MHDLHATGNILFKKRTKTLFSVYTLIKLIKFESLKAIELLCSRNLFIYHVDILGTNLLDLRREKLVCFANINKT